MKLGGEHNGTFRAQLSTPVKTLCSSFINRLSDIYISYQNRSRHDPRSTNLSLVFFTLLHTHMYIFPQNVIIQSQWLFQQVNQVHMFSFVQISNFHHSFFCLLLIFQNQKNVNPPQFCQLLPPYYLSFHNVPWTLHLIVYVYQTYVYCFIYFFWLTLLCFHSSHSVDSLSESPF